MSAAWTRRSLLLHAVATGASVLGCHVPRRASHTAPHPATSPDVGPTDARGPDAGVTSRYEVIVLGAGIAGLRAAECLRDAGLRACVIEARDRIGGRIESVRLGDARVDLGASHIENAPYSAVAARLRGIRANLLPSDSSLLLLNESRRSLSRARRAVWKQRFDDACARALRSLAEGHDCSAAEGMAAWFQSMSAHSAEARGAHWHQRMHVELTRSVLMDRLSLRALRSDHEPYAMAMQVQGGLATLTESMATGLEVLTQHVVRAIMCAHDGVRIESSHGILQAKALVCTVPIGVLRAGHIRFEPALEPSRMEAISRIEPGARAVQVASYAERSWRMREQFASAIEPRPDVPDVTPWLEDLSHWTGTPTLRAQWHSSWLTSVALAERSEEATRAMGQVLSISDRPRERPFRDWSVDPFALGARSALGVGGTLGDRERLAQPFENKVFFAGEATSMSAEGSLDAAYASGQRAADEVLAHVRRAG